MTPRHHKQPFAFLTRTAVFFPPLVTTAGEFNVHRQLRSRVLELWHLLSLDAPTVAVVWLWYFGRGAGHVPSFALCTALATATWAVYTLDRLLDARRGNALNTLQPRHEFHGRHNAILWPLTVLALLLSALMLAHAPSAEVRPLLWLTLVFAVWFVAVHARGHGYKLPKEFTTALVFTLAVALPSQTGFAVGSIIPSLAVFFLFALNTSLIPAWEATLDAGHPSARLLAVHAELVVALLWGFCLLWSSSITAAAAISGMLLLALHQKGMALAPTTRRAAADFALLTPVLWAAATPLRHAWLHVAVGLNR